MKLCLGVFRGLRRKILEELRDKLLELIREFDTFNSGNISMENLKILEFIDRGAFGSVVRAIDEYFNYRALKRIELKEKRDVDALKGELQVMKRLREHKVRGVCHLVSCKEAKKEE